MLWGLGRTSDSGGVVDNDSERFAAFKKLTPGKYKYVIGMNEPDFKDQDLQVSSHQKMELTLGINTLDLT